MEIESRLLVLVKWGFMYFTFNRGARLITGPDPLPLPLKEGHADKVAPS